MAFEHIVFMKAKAGCEAELDAVLPECQRLISGIPGVEYAAMGRNVMAGAPGGFTHASLVRLNDAAARPGFVPHPDHKASAALMNRFVEAFAIVDFEAQT